MTQTKLSAMPFDRYECDKCGACCESLIVRSGLPVIRIGKGSFVFADDLLAAIRQQQEAGS